MREQKVGSETLGSRSGISPRLISKYRAGTTEPRDPFGEPSENAHKLAAALGLDVGDLLPDPAESEAAA